MGAGRRRPVERYVPVWTDYRGVYGVFKVVKKIRAAYQEPRLFDQIMGTLIIMIPVAAIAYWVMKLSH